MGGYDCFLRWLSERSDGPWEALRETARWWFPNVGWSQRAWMIAERFSDLGHLDVDWTSKRWSVSPPVVNYLPPGPMVAVMCGARTATLTRLVRRLAADEDGPDVDMQEIKQDNG